MRSCSRATWWRWAGVNVASGAGGLAAFAASAAFATSAATAASATSAASVGAACGAPSPGGRAPVAGGSSTGGFATGRRGLNSRSINKSPCALMPLMPLLPGLPRLPLLSGHRLLRVLRVGPRPVARCPPPDARFEYELKCDTPNAALRVERPACGTAGMTAASPLRLAARSRVEPPVAAFPASVFGWQLSRWPLRVPVGRAAGGRCPGCLHRRCRGVRPGRGRALQSHLAEPGQQCGARHSAPGFSRPRCAHRAHAACMRIAGLRPGLPGYPPAAGPNTRSMACRKPRMSSGLVQ